MFLLLSVVDMLVLLFCRCFFSCSVHQVRYGGGGCIGQDSVRGANGAARVAGGSPVQ